MTYRWLNLRTGCAALALLALPMPAHARVEVITTNTVLKSIAQEVGGNLVRVTSLTRGTEDLHYVEPRPTMVTTLQRADLLVRQGLLFELWLDPVIQQTRNRDIAPGGKGYVDASAGIQPLEVPPGRVDLRQGEQHPLGNPHYHLNPDNARIIARNIAAGLKRVDPRNARAYDEGYNGFVNRLNGKIREWDRILAPVRGRKIVTYHRTWTYLLQRFGILQVGNIEDRPGIPPSARHIADLTRQMRAEGVKVVLKEPYFSDRLARSVAERGGARLLILPEWCGGAQGTDTYFQLLDHLVNSLAQALR